MLGLPTEQIVGKSVHELHALALRTLGVSAFQWQPAPDGGPPIEPETNVIETREQRPRVFHEFAAPVTDTEGHVLGRIYVYRDITKETELDRMKTEFIATVSHELRTPMTSIKGSLGLVLGGAAGDLPPEGAGAAHDRTQQHRPADPADQRHPGHLPHRGRQDGDPPCAAEPR